ncbi:hypothetical protein F3Y22_tig00111393pilonHSYRG00088 [Hibiscus syriacus]|uniref:Uncharacterized protein n=1 Tax=Hibiscus syriacus TaxID=106335 RepID=A0A6A2YL43_HIBSY|nr:hypothetical protein F3Y22_tig00111393pilonHSYRG00088 [Hibiscus syriacus]
MERKKGSSPGLSRAKSPARSAPPMSSLLRRRSKNYSHHPESFFFRSGGLRPAEALSPLKEGPDPDGTDGEDSRTEGRWAQWMKGQLSRGPSVSSSTCKRSDLRLLLGVLGAPLTLVHESASAQYILQQYTAASGRQKLQNSIHNAYAMGRVRMIASEFETANKVMKNRNSSKIAESGGFVLWQMNPDMWYVELTLGASKVQAGCNGKLVWWHTPWLGAHAAKGPVRPLRRHFRPGVKDLLRSFDMFYLATSARKQAFLCTWKTHLTRIQNSGGDAVYWETTINSFLEDYRPVEGIMIAHSGRSVVALFRFGDTAMSRTRTRMEEVWAIEEVAFNVPGLSGDCFIPPDEIRLTCEFSRDPRVKSSVATVSYRAKVGKLD